MRSNTHFLWIAEIKHKETSRHFSSPHKLPRQAILPLLENECGGDFGEQRSVQQCERQAHHGLDSNSYRWSILAEPKG